MHLILFVLAISILVVAKNYISEAFGGSWSVIGIITLLYFSSWFICKKIRSTTRNSFVNKLGKLSFGQALAIPTALLFFCFFVLLLIGEHEIGAFCLASIGASVSVLLWASETNN